MDDVFRLGPCGEDFLYFDRASGVLLVAPDESPGRRYRLSRREAVSLASVLLQFGTGKGVVS